MAFSTSQLNESGFIKSFFNQFFTHESVNHGCMSAIWALLPAMTLLVTTESFFFLDFQILVVEAGSKVFN